MFLRPLLAHDPPQWRCYALAILATGVCVLVRFLLDPWLRDQAPSATFIFGIMLTAVVGGLGPGILATILSILATDYFFYPPRFHFFVIAGPRESICLLLLGLSGVFISFLCQVLRRTEAAARRHAADLQAVYAGIPVGLCFLDAELRYHSINDRLAAINGQPVAEHLGRRLRDVLPADLADILEPLHRRVLQSGQPLVNYEISGPSPAEPVLLRHWMLNYYPVMDGQGRVVGMQSVVQDITDRKEAARQLEQREADLNEAQAMSHTGSFRVALPSGATTWSAETFRILGRDPSLGEPTLHEFIHFIHPADRDRCQRELDEACARAMPYRADFRVVRADGDVRFIYAMGRSFAGSNGQVAGLFGTIMDITDRRRAEEQLRQAKQEVEAASAAKDQFLAVLSHELRTPLTPVLAALSLLERNGHLESDSRDDVQMIRRNVELEARLIDDLLDVTRIVRGKLELRPQLVDVRQVLQHAVDICKPDFKTKDLHVSVKSERNRCWANADSARLQQVFWNLVKNAVKFTPDGGRVGIRCFCDSEQQIVVEVTDNGMGIDPALLPRLFNAFEQGGRATTRQFGGLGMGLAISKAIVELHGGSILAMSDGPGKGSTFRVTLPAAQPAEPLAEPVPAVQTPATAPAFIADGVSILLVEDHPDTAATMAHLLRASGYKVETATTMQTAREMAGRHRFDLLISDVGLPDGSGLELFRQLREKQPDLQGIAISGYGMEEDIRRSREAGFADHLVKPLDIGRLETVISRLVGVGSR